jgi:glucose/mannose-6-phosphate isomerase
VYECDRSNMWRLLEDFPRICQEAFSSRSGLAPARISSVVVTGMGGSAISGDVLKEWLDPPFPFEVCRGYHLPRWVSKETLVILISYSGETEETLSCEREARRVGAITAGIGSGGSLARAMADRPFLRVPAGLPSRAAFPYLFFSALRILLDAGLIPPEREEEVRETFNLLPAVRERVGEAREIATRLLGKIAFIYAPPGLWSVALRFKTQLNENAKSLAKVEYLPELCHNEIVGLTGAPPNVSFVLLRSSREEERISIRADFLKDLLKGRDIIELRGEGEGKLAEMLTLLYFGDIISYHLAGLKGVDPTPVEEIARLKKALSAKPWRHL